MITLQTESSSGVHPEGRPAHPCQADRSCGWAWRRRRRASERSVLGSVRAARCLQGRSAEPGTLRSLWHTVCAAVVDSGINLRRTDRMRMSKQPAIKARQAAGPGPGSGGGGGGPQAARIEAGRRGRPARTQHH
jgi:hypothetical protein